MSEAQQTRRISKVASELNVGVQTVIDFLTEKRFEDVNRNSKISDDMYPWKEGMLGHLIARAIGQALKEKNT